MNTIYYIIIAYVILINLAGFIAMYADKKKSIKKKWRIPERTLFLISVIGGSLGTFLGMHIFRHKTKHIHFVIGMPLILIFHAAATIFIYFIL